MKAIRTRYHSRTETKPARISARDQDGNQIIRSYDGGISAEANHYSIALNLRNKMDWEGNLVGGSYDGDMYWVFT